jgi:hypothetical protein
LKHGFEKLRASFGHALLDTRGNLGRGIKRVLQDIFEIPAQVFVIFGARRATRCG